MKRGALSLVAAVALAIAAPQEARADLLSDADLLASAWSEHAAHARHLPPLFLEHGRARAVSLPSTAYDTATPGCTSVAFLAPRSTDFVVRTDPVITPKHRPHGAEVDRSAAGTVLLTRCGEDRTALMRLSVELRVARAAVEVVEAEGGDEPPAISIVLPERASGPIAAPADPGPRPSLESLEVRAERAERRARREDAASVSHQVMMADPDGTGRETLRIDEGCHELLLFAQPSGAHPVDLDAELRDLNTERLVARDRSDSPDARLDLCVGSTAGVSLTYAGAPGAVPVLLSDARFPIPNGIPTTWGARARAGLVAALRRRQAPPMTSAPILETLGVAGVTTIPLELTPGACYLAAVATTRGEARSLAISARAGTGTSSDTSGPLLDGSAIAFCADYQARGEIEVEVRGSSVAWILAVWPAGQRILGASR